ncbi:MAG: hypothetical protein EXS14_09330 [Planctomycetes bacterium]|nr:hypothetical protein [Planctomycetota bacterium]
MKRFQFRLQKVLDVRALVLQDAKRAMARSLGELDALEVARELCRVQLRQAEEAIAQRLAEGQWEPRFLLALHGDLNRTDKAHQCAEAAHASGTLKVERAREELLKRRTEAESLEVLRRRAEESWEENMRRLDMADMDELASVRHMRRRLEEKTPC